MLTFEKLNAIFERGKKPYWVLYKGQSKGQQIGSNCLITTDEKPTISESFADLSEVVENYGDGIYTVECRTNPQTSRGNDIHTFMFGNVEEKPNRVSGATQVAHPASGFFSGLDARYFMDQISGATSEKQNLQFQLFQKELEIERLRRELKDKGSKVTPADRVFGLLEKNPAIIANLLNTPAPAAVGTLRAEKPIPEAADNRPEENDSDVEPYEAGKLDFNSMVEVAMRIQKAIPGTHVNDLLDGLADWIEDNPAQAQQYLSMLLK